MWESIQKGIMGLVALISVYFGSPQPPQQSPAPEPVVPAEEATPVAPADTPAEAPKESSTVPTKIQDPYCAKYVSKYTKAEYDKQKAIPDKEKKACEDQNKKAEKETSCDSISCTKGIQKNCKVYVEPFKDAWDSYLEQYDSYHGRC